jgi:DNA-binding transcriptional regulator YiaG
MGVRLACVSRAALARLSVVATVSQTSLAEEIARVSQLGNLSASHFAAATGGDPSSARRWVRGERAPSGEHATRALELTALVERLAHVMETTYIPVWLIKPIGRLDDRRPVDAIRGGDYRSVSRLVASLEGTPVS